MLWKLLLPTLLMFVAIRETIGQDYYGEGDYGDGDPLVGLDPFAGDGGFTGGAGGAGGDAGAGDTVDPNPPTPAPEPNPPTPAPEPDPFANRPVLPDGPGPACSVDIVLIVDESSSMSVSWFDRVKQFLVDFIGCFSFHHDVWTSFRDGVPSAAVVITDGSAQSDSEGQVTDDYAAQAAEARDAGIQLYAVGVGDEVDDAALQAIAGSPDRVFDSDIPCKVAFRILADLCTLSGVPGCVSFEGDSILPLGTSYQPETDGCITCTCSDDGHMMCSGVGCPLRYPPCSNEVNIAGRCCPDCVDDGPVPVGCWYNDILIPMGIEYKPDDCMTCTCPAPGEEPQCESMACIALHCANPVKIVGQCCPVCGGCAYPYPYGDVLIPAGSTYQPDPCTHCFCDAAGGRPMCAVQDCAAPPCGNNAVHVPGQCCPVCPDIGCQYEDRLILPGGFYQPFSNPCTFWSCFEAGGEPMQAIMDCAPPDPDCPHYVHIAGECCPRCQTDL
uniref:VWFA domain-containing protein n=1 Tax=Branchiostoma floridae TaxID=7739 RepID=C3YGY7_BRAFL|eukprot:XP_002604447.1 hypothetical protein BRAFLDRAFT_122285 [Branchiostoma floridae]